MRKGVIHKQMNKFILSVILALSTTLMPGCGKQPQNPSGNTETQTSGTNPETTASSLPQSSIPESTEPTQPQSGITESTISSQPEKTCGFLNHGTLTCRECGGPVSDETVLSAARNIAKATLMMENPSAQGAPVTVPQAVPQSWNCPSCGAQNSGKFCESCGAPRV